MPVVRVLVGFTRETGPPSTTERWNAISRRSKSMSFHFSAPSSPRLLDGLHRQRSTGTSAVGQEGAVEAFQAFDGEPVDPHGADVWGDPCLGGALVVPCRGGAPVVHVGGVPAEEQFVNSEHLVDPVVIDVTGFDVGDQLAHLPLGVLLGALHRLRAVALLAGLVGAQEQANLPRPGRQLSE